MNFFRMSHDDKYPDARYSNEVDWEKVICRKDPGHQRVGRRTGKLSIEIRNRRFGDVLWTFLGDCILTDKVLEVLKDNKITGFDVDQVECMNQKLPYDLWELKLTGWGGIAPKESGIELIESCSECKYLKYSDFKDPEKIIDTVQWDGNDIFMVWPLPEFIFVTEKVLNIFNREKINGVNFIELNKLQRSDGTLSPGRLSLWMDYDRASSLVKDSDTLQEIL